jgi:hypothetical protein
VRNRLCVAILHLAAGCLPRQARDKHGDTH